jgi:GNAT superfamily N-acetyltransferase
MELGNPGPLRWWHRLLPLYRSLQPCARPGCTLLTRADLELCVQHLHEARDILGDDACADRYCLTPTFGASRYCRRHFEHDPFERIRHRSDRTAERRRAVQAVHHRPVRGLEISYESFRDPAGGRPRRSTPFTLELEENDRRRRLYMFAYLDGRQVGHISAYLHTNNTALIRAIDVDRDVQRRGIASALYEALRAEHPGVLIDHGSQNDNGRAWWAGYCAARGLDPTDPRS